MTASLTNALKAYPAVMMEGAVIERIKRETPLDLDPHVLNTNLIYSRAGRLALTRIYTQYIAAAKNARLPILMAAPTWRANPERIQHAKLGGVRRVNRDAVQFLRSVCRPHGRNHAPILVGGLMACRNDAYRPQEALGTHAAQSFHQPQADALTEAGVDFIMAATLPARSEAMGLARVLASLSPEYILSFVIRADGSLLDGTPLARAIDHIDHEINRPPVFYMVNCVHPKALTACLAHWPTPQSRLKGRLMGIQANTSTKDPEDLDGSEILDTAAPDPFSADLMILHTHYGIKVLGGCCGTDQRHIQTLANRIADYHDRSGGAM